MSAEQLELRRQILDSLARQGFRVRNGAMLSPRDLSKSTVRDLHRMAVLHRIERARKRLEPHENRLLQRIANGDEIVPSRVSPRLVEVVSGSEDALLFRYASLHWSIPVSSGYGRRLRFLVVDDHNDKLIGLIGLADPVYSLAPRDRWIGWTPANRKRLLGNVMEGFVLGAVPPYSMLLCGKLVAMLAASDTVRDVFKRKYGGARSLISGRVHDGQLALITTASALGRSSIYNRLRFDGRLLYRSIGYTKGSGEFHFSHALYAAMAEFARKHCEPTAKHAAWGSGYRNRREIVRKCLQVLALPSHLSYHGVYRELFVVPLAANTCQYLQGQDAQLLPYKQSVAELSIYFRHRWMLPRVERDRQYHTYQRESYRLWPA